VTRSSASPPEPATPDARARVHNFSAGPATLPTSVLERARDELLCLPGEGASILEISHRSSRVREILVDARERIARLLALPDGYRVLFLPGGAQLQFSMVPMSFLASAGAAADYVLSGSWGRKALREAERFGETRVAATSEATGFDRVPSVEALAERGDAAYVHVTSNETIEGVQFDELPVTPAPLVCDASSDLLGRPIDASRAAMIYASAQKNLGPAGVTVVILREDFVERAAADLPTMLDYRRWIESDSLLNTAPVYAIYLVGLVLRWIEEEIGGLEAMALRNREKARTLYDVLDTSDGFYRGHAHPASRSSMNVTFRLPTEELETAFVTAAAERGLVGLKGHRSVGGIRASIYNAMSPEGVRALADFMVEFRRSNS